ncbi:sensor histidine kinase [Stakelama tenebrarum]|uniref:histidine kinase n=1 Tax=Stakelama tenebrarum TaxID=2711215 RepID=A0A6G6Y7K1_9SPHN|nr:ATP-binding protein [Sphingosinithalassobacter tenebrarum]QIG80553.1 HAMP domain-containing protein [Sphingosinithalassobacter tenebrarum]
MRRWRLPGSLPGQIALLVAIALFLAQAINFTLLYRERQQVRFTEIILPSVTRIVDAAERVSSDRFDRVGRSRVQLRPLNPIDPGLPRRGDVETAIARGLADADVPAGRIVTGLRDITPDDPRLRHMNPTRAKRIVRMGGELQIAVEIPGRGWLTLRAPWPRTERGLIFQLLIQTLILYAVVLLPVLWAGHRIARPLNSLAHAARHFRPGEPADPVEEHGPSDVRAVIAAFNALSLRVNAMIDEKDQMLGAIGHDLRTPLAALRVRIESVEDEEDRAKMADTIDEMNRTLDDILSLARLGRPSEPATDVDLAALLDAVVDDFQDLGADVTFEEAARLTMRMRPSLMRRAIRNLIENAIKYGDGAQVRLLPEARSVRIEVSDRGPGIPDDRIAQVFDPFTRLESSRNRGTGGIGLGLALARAIVREAGGEITLANRDGGGLTATIILPR